MKTKASLPVPNYPGTLIDWAWGAQAHKTGYCSQSRLSLDDIASRCWPDSCDVGFTVTSHKTGKKLLFTLERDLEDGHGSVYADVEGLGIKVVVYSH